MSKYKLLGPAFERSEANGDDNDYHDDDNDDDDDDPDDADYADELLLMSSRFDF